MTLRPLLLAVPFLLVGLPLDRQADAQGVATASIRGTIVTADSTSPDGAIVRILNTETGYVAETRVSRGRFFAHSLVVGGRYTVSVRLPGYAPQHREGLLARLGEPLDLILVMQPLARPLAVIEVRGAQAFRRINAHGGVSTLIEDSLVARLPTLNRNVYDFVQLAPQVTTNIADLRTGVSGAGANHRFNSFLVDGAEERAVNSNVSAAFNNGKSIPVDAVQEYQVHVAPYDVRFGDFAGAVVNTVTRAGTNELSAATFAHYRNERFGRAGFGDLPYERLQYGFAVSGPLVHDRVHFSIVPELQHLSSPAPGPFFGQRSDLQPAVPVTDTDVRRLAEALGSHGLAAGSGGPVEVNAPLRNFFTRLDAALPRWNGRLTATMSHVSSDDEEFSRAATDTFNLSTYRWSQAGMTRSSALRLQTDLPGVPGGHNELLIAGSVDRTGQVPAVRQPLVRVTVPGTGGTLVVINAGSAEPAHGRYTRSQSFRVRDDASIPLGTNHLLRLGFQSERFRTSRGGVSNGYGTWSFSSIENLERGVVDRFDLGLPAKPGGTTLGGWQHAAWIGDEWAVSPRLSLTLGMRADLLVLSSRPPYVAGVDSLFHRATDAMPASRIHVSPRLGFTLKLSDAESDQLRGGVGIFTGRPPLSWIAAAQQSYGTGTGVLRCGPLPTDVGPAPAFVPDHAAPPHQCANGGPPVVRQGDVDLIDRNLRLAQTLRASIAFDKSLGAGLLGTVEVLASRHLSDFMFVNLNLAGPQGFDRHGRVMYGAISAAGVASPALRSRYAEVIDLVNTSRNSSFHVSGRLERRFAAGWAASASYSWSRTRDVQSLSRVNSPGITLWGDARVMSGRHDATTLTTSLYDLPHRITAALTWTAPWHRTQLSLLFVGESGHPFTFVATGANRRGDLNADGSSINDPIHVPRNAMDSLEILISGRSDAPGADNSPEAQAARAASQRSAFERFIEASSCLRSQRGRILVRNSCREPWTHTTSASVKQTLIAGSRTIDVELNFFNLLNAIDKSRGSVRIAIPGLLEHVGQTTNADGSTQPVFRFDTLREAWTAIPSLSRFQMQMGARIRF